MILSNVNIGTGPSSGDGSPLRSAFSIINNNFQLITNNVNALTNSVTSVAGRTGNVILTINDIIGINVYASNSAIIAANLGMRGYVDTTISANIAALVDLAPNTLDTLRELADAIGDDPNFAVNVALSVSSANTKMRGYVDGQITAANAGVTSANLGMKGYVDNINTTLTANAATQSDLIIGINANVVQANLGMKGYVDSIAGQSTYGNANVASFLPTYGGNIRLNEITFNDLSEQTTAWLGSEWRSDLEANLTVKPSWLSYYPGGSKNIFGTSFGFGATGMFFTGDANYPAYPIRTNFGFHQDEHVEITTTINFVHQGADNSIAVFNSNVTPAFSFGANVTRIAFDSNFGTPVLGGLTTANTAPAPVYFAGNVYTVKFVYDRNATPSVTVSSFAGNTATGNPIDVRTLNEQLPLGLFTIGFDGDEDNPGQLAYFTDLSIKTYDDIVIDDLEIQGRITGNLIPNANVTYSLGSITNQWKDLFVSNNTIYIGGVPLSVINGNLTVGGNPISSSTYGNVEVGVFTNLSTYAYSANVTAANVGIIGYIDQGNSIQSAAITAANIGMKGYVDSLTYSNVQVEVFTNLSTYAYSANVTAANVGMQGYVDNAVLTANIGMKGYVDNAVATSGYSNVQVATYLPTYTGNVAAGNVLVTTAYRFVSGAVTITNDSSSVVLTPDTGADALAGVRINGNGYLLGPNGARNITLNYGGTGGAVGLQGNVTVGTAGSGNLFVGGNIIARDINASNILASGTSGKIGYSAGGYVIQSGNTSGVTLNTVSGNIKLDTVNIAVNSTHTVALTNNKLDANDIILVQGQDSTALDLVIGAYYLTTNTAIVYLRNISGSSIGPIAPALKFIIVKAPSS